MKNFADVICVWPLSGKSYTLNNETGPVFYPPTVTLTEGFHPELFIANGSHGIWGGVGMFEYARTPRLFDTTSRGFGWRTWGAIQFTLKHHRKSNLKRIYSTQ